MSSASKATGPLSLLTLAMSALRATKHIAPTSLPHWHANQHRPGLEAIRESLDRINAADTGVRKKGQPDIRGFKAGLAREIVARLDANSNSVDAATLDAAHRLGAIDMADAAAYDAYIALLKYANEDALRAVSSFLTSRVVLHVSCKPRLERAQESCASFAATVGHGISQIIVIGSSDTHVYRFDPVTGVLTVPAGDGYEHLPAKVIAAMTFFALCEDIQGVLKVDDDHRLVNVRELTKQFSRTNVSTPTQYGKRNNIGVLGNHVRVWHFGKCGNPALDSKPFTLPGATRWINGAEGYFVNRAALRLLLWSHVYFPEYIRIGLYEDMTVSDLIERQGGRIVQANMERILSTVEHY